MLVAVIKLFISNSHPDLLKALITTLIIQQVFPAEPILLRH